MTLTRILIACAAVVLSSWASSHAEPIVLSLERHHAQFSGEVNRALLISELNCTACHEQSLDQQGTRPGKGAPNLVGVGSRLQPSWLRAYLNDPQAVHPGTTMPDVLEREDPAERMRQVEALVHFLVAQKDGWKAPSIAAHSDPHLGGRLFRRIGCLVCHDDPEDPALEGRGALLGLDHVSRKYSYPALLDFLEDPLRFRAGGRMPDFHLNRQEAADVAAYLTGTLEQAVNDGRARLEAFEVDVAQAAAGRQLFRQRGCADCHDLPGIDSTLSQPKNALRADCGWAHYGFSSERVQVLQAGPLRESEQAKHRLAALSCYACHEREGVGGPSSSVTELFLGDPSLGNEGTLPPGLTGVGEKLTEAWLGEVLRGRGTVRSYLNLRMPFFGEANAQFLEKALVSKGTSEHGAPEVVGDIEAGRILLGTEGGVGCITCHGLGERRGLTLRALHLHGASKRYRPEWFRNYLIDPASHRPGTLMPSFWPQGVAGNQAVLGGDTDRQIASIWAYLGAWDAPEEGKDLEWPSGYPPFDAGVFELIPRDRPLVQRTFMEGAGTHAIAVGFPQGVHFAFDAEQCRLAMVWTGRFIDAYRPWFSRLDPTAEPLGEVVYRSKEAASPAARRFLGYRLDTRGLPTFHFIENVPEMDGEREHWQTFVPDGKKGLRLHWKTVHPDGSEEVNEEVIQW